ncbi:MAG: hypothetical protein RBR53_06265 [Desulforegulaceae bacterium]|nr:hypothetical protein [Desulforegulaceae bacterium]
MSKKNKSSFSEDKFNSSPEKEIIPEKEIWEYVSFDSFKVPTVPASSAAADLWSSFKLIFKREDKGEEIYPGSEEELYSLPSRLEEFLLPIIDFEDGTKALDNVLSNWLENPDTGNSVVYIVGQPYSGNSEILKKWAKNNDSTIIEPPDYDKILSGSDKLPESFPESGKLWVLPNLEKFFLRHVNGLKIIRKFLELAETGKIGKGVVGCQSFGWSYLNLIFRLSKKNVFTLQAFDNEKFIKLLSKSVQRARYTKFKFLNMSNGKKITGISSNEEPIDPFFTKLASFCRGNLLMQVNLWKEKLRLENENLKVEKIDLEKSKGKIINETIVWMSSEISESVNLPSTDEDLVIILHVLLLHDGLPEDILYKILPFSKPVCRSGLSYLLGLGLVKNLEGKCFVVESACYSVRKMLFERDYLVDKL